MLLAILFHFLCAHHVSDINISIIRSLWLFCWITTLVVLFLGWCGLQFWCGWVGVVFVLQAVVGLEWYLCCRLWLGWSGIRVAGCSWVGVVSVLQAVVGLEWYSCCRLWLRWSGIHVAGWSFSLQHGYHSNPTTACNTDTTPTQPDRNSNTHRTKNNTTNVVIQQNSLKLLMMDILMSETCWANKKWNKIASDIKLVFYSSTITMMHGPINIKLIFVPLLFILLRTLTDPDTEVRSGRNIHSAFQLPSRPDLRIRNRHRLQR